MKLDAVINHDVAPDGMSAFGITHERADQINVFMDSLFEQVHSDEGISKPKVVESIIEFANSTVEAVLLMGFFQSRFDEENIKHRSLVDKLEVLKDLLKVKEQ